MGLSYNVSYAIASFVICAILLLIVSLNYSSTNIVSRRYRFFLYAAMAMFALDVVTVATNDHASEIPLWVNQLLNGLYFFSSGLTAILFLYYCLSVALAHHSLRTRRIFYIINLSILGIYSITLIANAFTGFYFYFDPVKGYSHGDVYLLVNAASLLFTIESIVVFAVEHKQFQKRQLVCTTLFFVSFFVTFGLQLFVFPKVLLSDFGTAIGALITFFSIETPDYAKLMFTLNELNELRASLETQIEHRTEELAQERESYESLTVETLASLARVIDAKDHYTNGHSFRVAAYARALAQQLGKDSRYCKHIYLAGLAHDVGKIGISEAILAKPGKLTPEEFKVIQSHPALGGDILKGIHQFKMFEEVARHHHERYDGHGYPDQLAGEEIPYAARIVAIADTFDAMTSDRSYRKALSDDQAFAELELHSDKQFDGKMVDAFFKLCERYPDSIRNHIEDFELEN